MERLQQDLCALACQLEGGGLSGRKMLTEEASPITSPHLVELERGHPERRVPLSELSHLGRTPTTYQKRYPKKLFYQPKIASAKTAMSAKQKIDLLQLPVEDTGAAGLSAVSATIDTIKMGSILQDL